MQYGQLITRSFEIMWRHRYLWLLAILGGAADVNSGGFPSLGNLNSFNSFNRPAQPAPGSLGTPPTQFLQDYVSLIVAGVALLVVLALAWFLLSCVTTGALVRASAEHDAERPFRFGLAWRTGLGTFWSILGLRLLWLLLGLAALALLGLLVLFGFLAYQAGQSAALALVVLVGILLFLALIAGGILAGIVFILAVRSVVLEERRAIAGLQRALGLMRARLGRVLLVWLIQIGLGLVAGVAVAVPVVAVLLVVGGMVLGLALGANVTAAVVVGVPLGLLVLAGLIVLGGMIGTYFSTYWTLAFRRLELDVPRPAATWPPAAYPPTPQGYPPQPPAG
jgi:hypothetical protein